MGSWVLSNGCRITRNRRIEFLRIRCSFCILPRVAIDLSDFWGRSIPNDLSSGRLISTASWVPSASSNKGNRSVPRPGLLPGRGFRAVPMVRLDPLHGTGLNLIAWS